MRPDLGFVGLGGGVVKRVVLLTLRDLFSDGELGQVSNLQRRIKIRDNLQAEDCHRLFQI